MTVNHPCLNVPQCKHLITCWLRVILMLDSVYYLFSQWFSLNNNSDYHVIILIISHKCFNEWLCLPHYTDILINVYNISTRAYYITRIFEWNNLFTILSCCVCEWLCLLYYRGVMKPHLISSICGLITSVWLMNEVDVYLWDNSLSDFLRFYLFFLLVTDFLY